MRHVSDNYIINGRWHRCDECNTLWCDADGGCECVPPVFIEYGYATGESGDPWYEDVMEMDREVYEHLRPKEVLEAIEDHIDEDVEHVWVRSVSY